MPGYGAYWYESYPDGQVVTKIEGVDWSFSDKMFVCFINDLETYSKWEYSGESELLMALPEIEAIQLSRLKDTVNRVYEKVPAYRAKMEEAGVRPEHIQTLKDLQKLPFVTKQDMRDNYLFLDYSQRINDFAMLSPFVLNTIAF